MSNIRYNILKILGSPNPFFNLKRLDVESINNSKRISKYGYVSLGNILSNDKILSIRKKIDNIILSKKSTFNEKNLYNVIPNPLMIKEFFDLACNPVFSNIAKAYFKRESYLSDVDSRRIQPVSLKTVEEKGLSSSNWHRDIRGRQVKMMIYLTDVDKNDSNFSFFPKTHLNNFIHSFKGSRYNDNSFNEKPVEWYGKAGDAMMFDTNIIHRLRRKPNGRVRDSLTLYYTPGQFLKKIKIDSKFINNDKSMEIFNAPFWQKRV